ncbi:hypothetical protein [Armatimonas sp.]|uniref:hypothetical protein n=1 Tax=Armatimonas sp. TaxID=1872638 RepID=UPI003752648A
MHIRGDSDVAKEKYAAFIGESDARTNGNALSVLGRFETNKAHHVRIADNLIELCNGGSGIHAFKSHQVDIIHNTAYYNGASPELNWGQIFVQVTDDIRIVNNILVSRPNQPINSVGPDGGDQKSTRIVRAHNLYFGGLAPKLTGEGDLLADPQFVNPSTDPTVANFQLKPTSPARKSGRQERFGPFPDLKGKPRSVPPTRGAYEK